MEREGAMKKQAVEENKHVEEPYEDPCVSSATLAYSWQNTSLFIRN